MNTNILVNPDRKRFRISDVDKANVCHPANTFNRNQINACTKRFIHLLVDSSEMSAKELLCLFVLISMIGKWALSIDSPTGRIMCCYYYHNYH